MTYRTFAERLLHGFVKVMAWVLFRVRRRGALPIPAEGAAIIAPNHVTFLDAFIIAALSERPVRFIVDAGRARMPLVRWAVRVAGAIPIAPRKEEPQAFDSAFPRIAEALRAGELVCIFPEGALTRDGAMQAFKRGIERIVRETPVPVIPVALRGLWGSFFSRADNGPFRRVSGLWRRTVEVVAGPVLHAEEVTAAKLEAIVRGLRGAMA